MRTNDLFPVRVYFRDDRERGIAISILKQTRPDDAATYSDSAEGWVTADGLKQLTDNHLIVDSLALFEATIDQPDNRSDVAAPPPDVESANEPSLLSGVGGVLATEPRAGRVPNIVAHVVLSDGSNVGAGEQPAGPTSGVHPSVTHSGLPQSQTRRATTTGRAPTTPTPGSPR